MPARRRFQEALEKTGLRSTRQRSAILAALERREGFSTAQELFHDLRHDPAAPGLATVYRTLSALAAADVVDTSVRGGEQVFRLCSPRHHHHLVCESCGRVEEVASEELESWVRKLARRRGFRVTGHTAEVYGVCGECA